MFFYVFFLFNLLEVEIFKKQKDRFVCDVKAKAHRLKKYKSLHPPSFTNEAKTWQMLKTANF